MLKRLFNENRLDLMIKLLSEKKYREFACKKYIEDNSELSANIISDFNLELIDNKYFKKNRLYTDGSYSKKKIRNEEKNFISKFLLFRYFKYQVHENLIFFKELKSYISDEKNITDDEFLLLVYVYRHMKKSCDNIKLFDIDNQVDINNIWEMLNIKGAREQLTIYFIKNDFILSEYIIKNNKYLRVDDKYIKKINDYTNNTYSRNKIKQEEIYFCLKIIALERWKYAIKDLVEYTNYYEHYFHEQIEQVDEYLWQILYEEIKELKEHDKL